VTSVRRRSSLLTSSANPVRDGDVAHADRFTDLRLGEPEVVRLECESGSLVGGPLDGVVGAPELFQQLSCAYFVGDDLLGGADWSTDASFNHAAAPSSRVSVELGVAHPVGTWKYPTRISLGQGMHGVSLRSMVCDRQVAHSAVNGDRCSPCSLAIVLCTLRSPTGRTVEYFQCCHFSTYTRRNRQFPVSDPPTPSRSARAQPGDKPDRRTASLNPTRTAAKAENSRGEH
jgi:hypothetical protein